MSMLKSILFRSHKNRIKELENHNERLRKLIKLESAGFRKDLSLKSKLLYCGVDAEAVFDHLSRHDPLHEDDEFNQKWTELCYKEEDSDKVWGKLEEQNKIKTDSDKPVSCGAKGDSGE